MFSWMDDVTLAPSILIGLTLVLIFDEAFSFLYLYLCFSCYFEFLEFSSMFEGLGARGVANHHDHLNFIPWLKMSLKVHPNDIEVHRTYIQLSSGGEYTAVYSISDVMKEVMSRTFTAITKYFLSKWKFSNFRLSLPSLLFETVRRQDFLLIRSFTGGTAASGPGLLGIRAIGTRHLFLLRDLYRRRAQDPDFVDQKDESGAETFKCFKPYLLHRRNATPLTSTELLDINMPTSPLGPMKCP